MGMHIAQMGRPEMLKSVSYLEKQETDWRIILKMKKMDLKVIGHENVKWIELAQDKN
jgi:hypothetical protein